MRKNLENNVRNKREYNKLKDKQGMIVGFIDGHKSGELVVVDIGEKLNSKVSVSDFKERPIKGEKYFFSVISQNESGEYKISRSLYEKRVKKYTTELLNSFVNKMTSLKAKILQKEKNGYTIEILNSKFNKFYIFLNTEQELKTNDIVDVIIANFDNEKIKCVLKVDETLPVQPGELITGKIISGNDFFAIVSSDKIPSSYEVNVYKHDYNSQIDEKFNSKEEQKFIVLWTINKVVFCKLAEEELEIGKVYSGTIEAIKHIGIQVSIKNNTVFINSSELSWSSCSEEARRLLKIGDYVDVYILSNGNDEDKKIKGSLKMSNMAPLNNFIQQYNIGSNLEVVVVAIPKIDNKNNKKSQLAFVKPKDPKHDILLVVYLGVNNNIEVDQTLHVTIKNITADHKIQLSVMNNRFRVNFSKKYNCVVTDITSKVIKVALSDNPLINGILLVDDTSRYSVDDTLECFIEIKSGSYTFKPVNYLHNTSETSSKVSDIFDELNWEEI